MTCLPTTSRRKFDGEPTFACFCFSSSRLLRALLVLTLGASSAAPFSADIHAGRLLSRSTASRSASPVAMSDAAEATSSLLGEMREYMTVRICT